MKRIFLLSTLVIASLGMMNLQSVTAAPQQSSSVTTPAQGANAKKLVSKINQAVTLQGTQFSAVNRVCIQYFQKLDAINSAKPTDAQTAGLKKTRDEQIKALLTPDQLKLWPNFKE